MGEYETALVWCDCAVNECGFAVGECGFAGQVCERAVTYCEFATGRCGFYLMGNFLNRFDYMWFPMFYKRGACDMKD
jgi:hypothetical protein